MVQDTLGVTIRIEYMDMPGQPSNRMSGLIHLPYSP